MRKSQISFSDMIYVCSSMFLFGSNSTAIIYIYQQPAETISGRQKYLKKTSHTEGTGLYNMVHICSIMDVSP